MKLLFCDIDGVLNCDRSFDQYTQARERGEKLANCQSEYFAPWSVAALNRITNEARAHIVISSSWRDDMDVVRERFQHFGITGKIIGHTPLGEAWLDWGLIVPEYANRGQEIDAFLREYANQQFCRRQFWRADFVTQYVILDDNNVDSGDPLRPHHEHFVQTDFRTDGLTDEDATRAIEILSRSRPLTLTGPAPTCLVTLQQYVQDLVNGKETHSPRQTASWIRHFRDEQAKVLQASYGVP